MKKFWDWVRTHFWMILGAKIFLSGIALLLWWAYPSATEQANVATEETTSTVGILVAILVGLFVTGILSYLVVRKFRERPLYGRNKEKQKPAKERVSASSKKQKPVTEEVAARTSSKRGGWLWPAIAIATLLWLIFGDSLKETRQVDTGGAESSRNVTYRVNEPLSTDTILAVIADCESGGDCMPGSGRQFNGDGSVVTNQNDDGTTDVGKWQINSRHEAEAKELGIDLRTEEGNRKFAEVLYAREGTVPWNASRDRWEPLLLGDVVTYTVSAGRDVVFDMEPGHRWEMVGEIPQNLKYKHHKDDEGYIIQRIALADQSAGPVTFRIRFLRCTLAESCAT